MAKKDIIGSMRERIDIVEPQYTTDTYGQDVETWIAAYLNTHAEVQYRAQGSNEEFESGKKTSFTSVIFRIRAREMDEKFRIVYRAKEYEIDSIAYTPDRCFMLIEAREDDKVLYSG